MARFVPITLITMALTIHPQPSNKSMQPERATRPPADLWRWADESRYDNPPYGMS
jgi:hypothetical protein